MEGEKKKDEKIIQNTGPKCHKR